MVGDHRLLSAIRDSAKALASTADFEELLHEVLAQSVEAVGAEGGTIYLHDPSRSVLEFVAVLPHYIESKLPTREISDDYGLSGRAFTRRSSVVQKIDRAPDHQLNPFELATGIFVDSVVAVPLMMKDETPIGVVQLINKEGGEFTSADVAVVESIASMATLAYVNRKLALESARGQTLLGMGKVSHDIGNLAASLHASINYSEMALEGMRSHMMERSMDAEMESFLLVQRGMFQDLKQSVDRIVGYSYLISDMSAGRPLRPNRRSTGLAEIIARSASYLEPDARSKQIEIHYDLCDGAPQFSCDELYIFRIVQNLVGNAIKAVSETVVQPNPDRPCQGTITIRYRVDENDHLFEVQDTGPGMSDATRRRILEGESESQWNRASGSGWGLRIVHELAASHDGKLEIDSEMGGGSTFRIRFTSNDRLPTPGVPVTAA